MSIGKLVAILALGSLAWEHQEVIGRHTDTLQDIGPIVRTYVEMRMYRTPLMVEMNRNRGRPPRNLQAFLDSSFNRGNRRASQDLFGTPYRINVQDGRPVLRSCGPDALCGSDDDLVVALTAD